MLRKHFRAFFAYATTWVKSFFLSIHDVSTETRPGPAGTEVRLTFDSKFGPHTTPWVSEEEATAIMKRMVP